MGMGWMGWMDGMVGQLFFFYPYLENYYIFFLNCFSSLKYMFLHIFWNIRRKKNRNILFFKIFRQNHRPLFFQKCFQGFLNFSKTTRYIFLIVFGPLRRVINTSFEKKIKKNRILFLSKNFASFFFDEIWKIFKGISPIKTKVDFSRYRVRTPVRALSSNNIKENLSNIVSRRDAPGNSPPQSHAVP